MRRFIAGVLVGSLFSALALAAQHRASEKVVPPQVVVENPKVRIVRWVLKPGEGTPIHTHALDHISVVIHGSTLHIVETSGAAQEMVQKTGDVTFNPGTGVTHSFANAGKTTFESISIELK